MRTFYTPEFKFMIVEELIAGAAPRDLEVKYGCTKFNIASWKKKYFAELQKKSSITSVVDADLIQSLEAVADKFDELIRLLKQKL